MPNKSPPMKLSREEEGFLRHWMYDKTHYQDGPGPAKQFCIEQPLLTWPPSLPLPSPTWTTRKLPASGPRLMIPPMWPWIGDTLRTRIFEAQAALPEHGRSNSQGPV